MTTEHELNVAITNLRNHLFSEIGARKWMEILTTVAKLRGYFEALEAVKHLKALDIDKGALTQIYNYLDKIADGAKHKDQGHCNAHFLMLNEFLVGRMNIPPIIDQ